MRRTLATLIALLVLGLGDARAGDPTGHYSVRGTNPGTGSTYKGDVSVTRTGATYKVVWIVGHSTYVGTGLGHEGVLAVSYQASDGSSGLVLLNQDYSGGWKGTWSASGGTQLGTEVWVQD